MPSHPAPWLTRSAVLALLLGGSVAQAASVVVDWNAAALDEVRRLRLGPPIVARALAVAHSCMYEAWAAYDPTAAGEVANLPKRPAAERSDANKAKAVSYAAFACLNNLFPNGTGRLTSLMARNGYNPSDTSTDPGTPQGIGNLAAAAVIAARRNDGANQYGDLAAGAYADYTGYVPSNPPALFCQPHIAGPCPLTTTDPLSWQPLINQGGVLQTFIAPHWERVQPFALTGASQFDSRPEVINGPDYRGGPDRYLADAQAVLAASAALDPQRKLIVEYWADGPASELPPGHWGLFAQAVSARDRLTIDGDVKLFYAMHNASFDAGIVAWHLKRKYNGVRPITAIRYLGQGRTALAWGGPDRPVETIDLGKWSPYNPGSNLTPAFPGFISGHATFSAASAAVLRNFTGSDAFNYSTVIPAGFGRVEANVPPVPTTLSYPTFTAAANEAAASRLYGGIHFADDNNVGLVVGDLVGQQAWAKARYLFDGGLMRGATSQAASGLAAGLTWSHTVDSRSNRLLVVGVSTTSALTSATSVNYGGIALQRLGTQNGPYNDNRVELWYLVNPPAGTRNVSVQLSWLDDVVGGAMSFNGVHQGTPFGTFRSSAGESNGACLTLANGPAPLVATVVSANGDAGWVSPAGNLSQGWNGISDHSLWGLFAFSDIIGVGASGPAAPMATLCNSLGRSKRWAMVAVPLVPAVGN